jgi:hypothetical protein
MSKSEQWKNFNRTKEEDLNKATIFARPRFTGGFLTDWQEEVLPFPIASEQRDRERDARCVRVPHG